MSKETGGAAFPNPYFSNSGMTLRDYFAAKAMQAAMSNPDCNDRSKEDIAFGSYRIADAMLSARSTEKARTE